MARRFLQITPTTTPGKWSVALIVAMPILFIVGSSLAGSLYKDVPAAGSIQADIAARPALALTMLAGMACGLASFITGLLAIIRQREPGALVYLATAVGGLLLIFLVGEVSSPH